MQLGIGFRSDEAGKDGEILPGDAYLRFWISSKILHPV